MQSLSSFVDFSKKRGVPIILVSSYDPIDSLSSLFGTVKVWGPFWTWNRVTGSVPHNGAQSHAGMDEDPVSTVTTFTELCGDKSTLLMSVDQEILDMAVFQQALWEVRDRLKVNHRTVVMVTQPLSIPEGLRGLVVRHDEPLPTREFHRDSTVKILDQLTLPHDGVDQAVDMLVGLNAFVAEQITALSLTDSGLDLKQLWALKKRYIAEVPNLSVVDSGLTYSDVVGHDRIKNDLLSRLQNKVRRYTAVVWFDEFEKSMGLGNDAHEVSKDQHKVLLEWMDPDNRVYAVLLVGVPGSGKSLIAKTTGSTAGLPTFKFDLGASKGSGLVGQAERAIRMGVDTIKASSTGSTLVIATTNDVQGLSPELKSRFTDIYFFDTPTKEECLPIWELYMRKYELSGPVPRHDNWTGREIRACCERAYERGISLVEASQQVVPVAVSSPEVIHALRNLATDRFLSTAHPGRYTVPSVVGRGVALGN